MLKILDEHFMRTDSEMGKLYKDSKYIYIIDSLDKVADEEGYLYCVSTSPESMDELYDEEERLSKEGKYCVVSGSYNNGDG